MVAALNETMPFLSRLTWLFALLIACTPVSSSAARPFPPDLTARIDAILSAHDRPDTPGCVVGVIEKGKLVWSRAYGMADLDHAVPLSTRTPFHLASLSKQFTGAAAALLILDGKLSLSDPVARWVPAAAKFGPGLRVEHLIYMTSGLPEYWGRPRPAGTP